MPGRTTKILLRVCRGDADAAEELFPLVYDELRGLARGFLRRETPGHTLQPTALIHEAYLRLIDQDKTELQSRSHFVAIAARSMRQILVDHARRKKAHKRGGEWMKINLDEALAEYEESGLDILALHDSLAKLEQMDGRKARVVELRFFGGLTVEEAADVLEVSPKTVEADWYMARAWLRGELGEAGNGD